MVRSFGIGFAGNWRRNASLGLLLCTALSSGLRAQDMQGFDPKAAPVPEFKLTPF